MKTWSPLCDQACLFYHGAEDLTYCDLRVTQMKSFLSTPNTYGGQTAGEPPPVFEVGGLRNM